MNLLTQLFNNGVAKTFVHLNPNAPQWQTMLIIGICILFSIVIPYLIGSINFAIVLSKLRGEDIRNHGSKNAGATNMLRTYGKKAAIITLAGDFFKGTFAVLIGMLLFGMDGQYLAALFAVLGHVFPIYYKFKGGKGIATAAGTILACEPLVLLVLLFIFALIVGFTKYVSLASITVAFFYPLLLDRYYKIFLPYEGYTSGIHILFVFILSAVVFFKHYPNMKRLLNRTESKVSFKKKAESTEQPEEKKSLHNDD